MLRMSVGKATIQGALRSNMHDTPAGARMHDRLVAARRVQQAGVASHYVTATPEEWEELLVWCRRRAVTAMGDDYLRRLGARSAAASRDRIVKALARLCNHPGYRGQAVIVRDTTVLPAHQKAGDDRWWPTERLARESPRGDPERLLSGSLVPVTTYVRKKLYTVWEFSPASPSSLREASFPSERPAAPRQPAS